MPLYEYVCSTPHGDYAHGELEAPDNHRLAAQLEQEGLFLITWKEKRLPPPESKPTVPAAEPEAGPPVSLPGVFGWIADHSFGAVENKPQALLVTLILIAVVVVTALHVYVRFFHNTTPWLGVIPPSG